MNTIFIATAAALTTIALLTATAVARQPGNNGAAQFELPVTSDHINFKEHDRNIDDTAKRVIVIGSSRPNKR